jgi:hypothetical protein
MIEDMEIATKKIASYSASGSFKISSPVCFLLSSDLIEANMSLTAIFSAFNNWLLPPARVLALRVP